MENLISIDKLIKSAKKKGVDFGKGDPYNRLRYYTKMGWLPHTVRKRDKKGNVTGHYPTWSLEHLVLIESLKDQGFSNDEITKKLSTKNKIVNVLELLRNKDTRNQLFMYLGFGMLLIIFLSELDILRIGKPKSLLLNADINQTTVQMLDSGTAFVPKGQNSVFVKAPIVNNNTKVYVTFNHTYTPANQYWVDEVREFEGFILRLDAPVSENPEFNWWITN